MGEFKKEEEEDEDENDEERERERDSKIDKKKGWALVTMILPPPTCNIEADKRKTGGRTSRVRRRR